MYTSTSTHTYTYRKAVKETEYKGFIISKTQNFKHTRTANVIGTSCDVDTNETPVKGSARYEAHTKEDNEMQAMTEEYKTMKEVKAAIDNGDYIEY